MATTAASQEQEDIDWSSSPQRREEEHPADDDGGASQTHTTLPVRHAPRPKSQPTVSTVRPTSRALTTSSSALTPVSGKMLVSRKGSQDPPQPIVVKNMLLQMENYDFWDQERAYRRKMKQKQQMVALQSQERPQTSMSFSPDEGAAYDLDPRNPKTFYGIGTCGLGQKQSRRDFLEVRRNNRKEWTEKKNIYDAEKRVDEQQAAQMLSKRAEAKNRSAAAFAAIHEARNGVLQRIKNQRKEDEAELKQIRGQQAKDQKQWSATVQAERDARVQDRRERRQAKEDHERQVALLNKQEYELHRAVATERKLFLNQQRKELAALQLKHRNQVNSLLKEGREHLLADRMESAQYQRKEVRKMLQRAYDQTERDIHEQTNINSTTRDRLRSQIAHARNSQESRASAAASEARKKMKKEEELRHQKQEKSVEEAHEHALHQKEVTRQARQERLRQREIDLQKSRSESPPRAKRRAASPHKLTLNEILHGSSEDPLSPISRISGHNNNDRTTTNGEGPMMLDLGDSDIFDMTVNSSFGAGGGSRGVTPASGTKLPGRVTASQPSPLLKPKANRRSSSPRASSPPAGKVKLPSPKSAVATPAASKRKKDASDRPPKVATSNDTINLLETSRQDRRRASALGLI